MRKALLVGIDDYPQAPLAGCVRDATEMRDLLATNDDGSPNFDCRTLLSTAANVSRQALRQAITNLFGHPCDLAVLYFSGHGTANNLGGYLVTQDATAYDEGVSMTEVLTLANNSQAREAVIILDCCHSGALGQLPAIANDQAVLREGISVLSASRDNEAAIDTPSGGLFTTLVRDALQGGAADVCGKITVASVYAYVDQALGAWQQRPLFKAHVARLLSLRTCEPPVPADVLRRLPKYFPEPSAEYALDPSYERTVEPRDPEHEEILRQLQQLRNGRLLVPVGEDHLYYAAINSRSCKLTALGRFYWHLANTGKL